MLLPSLFQLVLSASSALAIAFNPPRFSAASWNLYAKSVGVRVFGAAPDRRGFLELTTGSEGMTDVMQWRAAVRLFGTVTTAEDSDFAAVSAYASRGMQIFVFFVRDDGALVYGQWTDGAAADMWTLHTVGGAALPSNSRLGAEIWRPGDHLHMSVFYQDGAGTIMESEFANGTWAAPRTVGPANLGTTISVVDGYHEAVGSVKVVYVQEGASILEWVTPFDGSESVGWQTLSTITPSPEQSVNYRFTVDEGRIHYTTSGGAIGEMTGEVGWWEQQPEIPVSNAGPATDLATTTPFFGWTFAFYSAVDGTLWSKVYVYNYWRQPTQLVPSKIPSS